MSARAEGLLTLTTQTTKAATDMAKPAKTHWRSFTKAELIRTIKTLSARETKLLNRIAKLESGPTNPERIAAARPPFKDGLPVKRDAFPWETKT